MWPFPFPPQHPKPSREAAKDYSPQPALSLSKGRKSWDRGEEKHRPRRACPEPGRTILPIRMWSGRPRPLLLTSVFKFCWRKAPGRARLQPCRQSPAKTRASAPEVRSPDPSIQLPPLSFRHASEANEEESVVFWDHRELKLRPTDHNCPRKCGLFRLCRRCAKLIAQPKLLHYQS
jgi:hypothetical protein